MSSATPTPRPTGTPRSMTRVGSARPPSRAPPNLRRVNTPKRVGSTPTPAKKPLPRCPNPECASPEIQDVEGQQTCISCGATIADSNIVSEVTFGESTSGAAVVQGGFVGEGQRYAKTLGPAFKRGGITDSREVTEGTGREEIRKIANFLKINNDSLVDRACNIYKLAVSNRFILGRRVRTVAAVCLYTSCRMTGGESTVLLIDFAEAIRENVFRLGEVFQDMRKQLYLDPDSTNQTVGGMPLIEVEDLIQRYCMKLEFRDKTQRVANDAAQILKRMKRDWMVTGRQPSGLCGSCILLAARMNNFRRTSREIAYVVKVADITVGKRLEEFKRTDSAALSIEQFRQNALRLRKQHDPPVLWEQRQKALKKRKLYEMWHGPRGNPDQTGAEPVNIPDDLQRPRKLRRDAEGFAIPPKPVQVDPALSSNDDVSLEDTEITRNEGRTPSASPSPGPWLKQTKGRQKKSKTKKVRQQRPEMRILTEQDILEETELEQEIEQRITDEEVLEYFDDVKFNYYMDLASKKADEVRTAERERKRSEIEKRRKDAGLTTDLSANQEHDSDADENDSQPFVRQRSHPPLGQGRIVSSPSKILTNGERPAASEDGVSTVQSSDRDSESVQSQDAPPTIPEHGNSTCSLDSDAAKRKTGRWDILSDSDISPSEFDSDPEVKYCRLSEADVLIKEKIWVNDNEQWLRDRQAKELRKAIYEARGPQRKRSASVASGEHGADVNGEDEGPQRKKKRRGGKMGDGAVVREGGAPKSAAEAVERMVKKRSKGFSRYINKGALNEHFESLYSVRKTSQSNGNTSASGSADQRSREETEVLTQDIEGEGVEQESSSTSGSTNRGGNSARSRKEERQGVPPLDDFYSQQAGQEVTQDPPYVREPEADEDEYEESEYGSQAVESYQGTLEGAHDLEDLAAEFDDEDDVHYDDDEEIGFEGEEYE